MDLLMWHIRKNCSLFITSGTLSQLTGNTSICNTSKINFRRLEALFCGVWPSPGFSLLSSRISLQNREKCRFEPTFKKARPARLSERKSLISSGFRRVRGLQKRPQNGHPRHSCIKDSLLYSLPYYVKIIFMKDKIMRHITTKEGISADMSFKEN